jgi:FixJ family two-component response regulator
MALEQHSSFVAILDDDDATRDALLDLVESERLPAVCFKSAEEFIPQPDEKPRVLLPTFECLVCPALTCRRRLDARAAFYRSSSSLAWETSQWPSVQ